MKAGSPPPEHANFRSLSGPGKQLGPGGKWGTPVWLQLTRGIRKRLLTPRLPSLPPISELPVSFTRLLQDVVATQKEKVTLECELSRPVDVRWLKVFLHPPCFSLWASGR